MASPKLLKGRNSQPGAWYMVTTVTHERRPLFAQAQVADAVIAEIQSASDTEAVKVFAWVLMPDHLHWLFQLRSGGLGACMQAFKSRSAHAVNAIAGSRGAVWQPGFYDHRLRSEEDLTVQARYLLENPLRKGLVQRIEEHPYWWCSWIERGDDL